jgi:putative ABC transport system permease protein
MRGRWLDDIQWDVRYAMRQFQRHRGFTLAAVAMLAFGIGVNAAVFTITNAILFRGFPQVDPENRLLYVTTRGTGSSNTSYADFEDWRARAKSFAGLSAVASGGSRLGLSDRRGSSETYDATLLSANAFQVLGQQPILGRDFVPSDETAGAAPVVILSYSLWERRYAKDPATVGETVRLSADPFGYVDGALATVIGVMPSGFDFPHHRVDLWMPLVAKPELQNRQARTLWFAFGRPADGVTLQGARAEMDMIGRQLAIAYPLTNQGFLPLVMSFHEFYFGPGSTAMYGALWGAVGFVLLIACANVANLLLARAIGRSREVSVRIALGAGRWRIVRQLLIESVMLSTAGGILGWWLARWGVRTYELLAQAPTSYDRWVYAVDSRVFAYVLAISIGTGLLFGLAPALRLSTLDVNTTLKGGGRGVTGGEDGKRVAGLLVIVEVALALVLLVGAGVMTRSFLNVYARDLGLDPTNILIVNLNLPPHTYPRPEAQLSFFDRLTTRVQAIPGVESVALATGIPAFRTRRVPYELAGAEPVDDRRRPTVPVLTVSPGYFRTLGAAVLAGRDFDAGDGASAARVAIVNQRFANEHWPGEDPLGRRIRLFSGTKPDAWLTVIGIASNIVQDNTRQEFGSLIYVPYRQQPVNYAWVLARTRVPPERLGAIFTRELHALDSDLTWFGPNPLAERLAFNYWTYGTNGALFLMFAAIALLLASIGLYAVVAHSVGRRMQEIGIRMAIGATARDIVTLVASQGMLPVGIGLVVGLAASLAITPLLRSQLVGVSPADPMTFAIACTVLVASAMLGCWLPARRAIRVDPVIALRHE